MYNYWYNLAHNTIQMCVTDLGALFLSQFGHYFDGAQVGGKGACLDDWIQDVNGRIQRQVLADTRNDVVDLTAHLKKVLMMDTQHKSYSGCKFTSLLDL